MVERGVPTALIVCTKKEACWGQPAPPNINH